MAEVQFPQQPAGLGAVQGPSSNTSPAPNPHFVFPAPSGSSHTADLSRTDVDCPSSQSRMGSLNRNKPHALSITPLPAFQFGGGSSPRRLSPSPTRSPARLTPPIHAGSGHRRGGSEFVGGNATNPMTATPSPAKDEGFQLPPTPPTKPSAGRRGHAHRRSGALSQHDLSAILKPGPHAHSSSTVEPSASGLFSRPLEMENARPLLGQRMSSSDSVRSSYGDGQLNAPRTKVTFSDPEYVLRPLSTISSETSSSLSTIRAGHSVTDSISSFVSGDASSPSASRRVRSRLDDLSESGISVTPPTSSSPDEEPRVTDSSANISSGRGPTTTSRLADFDLTGRELCSGNASSTPAETSEPASDVTQAEPQISSSPYSSHFSSSETHLQSFTQDDFPVERPRTSPEPKEQKRQSKVKSWAGRIKKPRSGSHRVKPIEDGEQATKSTSPHESNFSLEDINFDEDTSCIIENGPPSMSYFSGPSFHTSQPSTPVQEDGHVLDLDMALASPERPRTAGRASDASGKRRMHSSEKLGGFSGPGGHYHRRAESMPELENFEQVLGFGHRSSNPAMSEAIEEEEEGEEEDEQATASTRSARAPDSALGVHVVDMGSPKEYGTTSRRRQLGVCGEINQTEGQLSRSHQGLDTVEIVSAEDEPRFASPPSGDTLEPSSMTSGLLDARAPDCMDQGPLSNSATPQTPSNVPSPDFGKTSFDKHNDLRIHTAHSSITDRTTLNSSRTGDQRLVSVDDVPSLTSSASTMISGHPNHYPAVASGPFASADRSLSLSAAVPPRVRSGNSSKRSSLVSLSRLVGSSHNKSKLNIAELAPPDSPEKPEKKKKRMSRLKFWKSKERLSST